MEPDIYRDSDKPADGRTDWRMGAYIRLRPLVIKDNIKIINSNWNYSLIGIRPSCLIITADEIISFLRL